MINPSVYKPVKDMSFIYIYQKILVLYTTEQSHAHLGRQPKNLTSIYVDMKRIGTHTPADLPHTETFNEIVFSIYAILFPPKNSEKLSIFKI